VALLSTHTSTGSGEKMPSLDPGTKDRLRRACARFIASAHRRDRARCSFRSLPAWTIRGILEISATVSPDKSAIVALDHDDPTKVVERIRYSELVGLVRSAANHLHEASGSRGPVISILTPLAGSFSTHGAVGLGRTAARTRSWRTACRTFTQEVRCAVHSERWCLDRQWC
jgi:hypothetical protein